MRKTIPTVALLVAAAVLIPCRAAAEIAPAEVGAFSIVNSVTLPCSPLEAYDAMTGDISGWWDHHLSAEPAALLIEPRPGGGFREEFGDGEDGVRHAVVIHADRGVRLTMEGPLGLSGFAITMVTTYEFTAVGDGTKVTVTANLSGQIEPGWDEAVDRTWRHFLNDRLLPYVKGGFVPLD